MTSKRGEPSTHLGDSAGSPGVRAAGTGPRGWTVALLLAPAVAVVGVMVSRGPARPTRATAAGPGEVRLRVLGPAGPLRSGAVLSPGEVLRFGARTPHPGYALVVGLDRRGQLSTYCPPGGAASTWLDRGGDVELPCSATLDAHAGAERFYLLFTRRPASVRDIEDAIRAGHTSLRDPLPISGAQASLWVEQGAPAAAGGSVDPTPGGR